MENGMSRNCIRKICARGRKGSVVLKNGEPSQKTKGLDFGIIAAEEFEGKMSDS